MRPRAKKIIRRLAIAIGIIVAIFLTARYGWRLFGFTMCRDTNIIGVYEVTMLDDEVEITGFDPSSFPTYLVGYKYKIEDENLYLGLKYNYILGSLLSDATGEYRIRIPLDGKPIENVYIKDGKKTKLVWNRDVGRVK